MTPLIHYLFAVLAIYATGYHVKKHRFISYVLIAVAVDMVFEADHLFPIYTSEHIKLFHNFLFALFVPLALFLVAAAAEGRYSAVTGVKDSRYQRFFLVFILVSVSHITLDLIDGGEEYLLYPFVKTPVVLNPSLTISYPPFMEIPPWFLLLILYGTVVLLVRLMENTIYDSVEGGGEFSRLRLPSPSLHIPRYISAAAERLSLSVFLSRPPSSRQVV